MTVRPARCVRWRGWGTAEPPIIKAVSFRMSPSPMSDPLPVRRPLREWLVRGASLAAALVGLIYGFDFGLRLDGIVIGIVAAVNCGVFGALVAGALAEKLLPSTRSSD
jgi:hypothetical protein